MLLPKVVWIVVDDSLYMDPELHSVLERCEVESVHLFEPTMDEYQERGSFLQLLGEWSGLGASAYERKVKGVEQRNAGLQWLRKFCSKGHCDGVVYFADDDNTYSLQLFEMVGSSNVLFCCV